MKATTLRNLSLITLSALLTACAAPGGTEYAARGHQQLQSITAWQQPQSNSDVTDPVYLTDLINSAEALSLVQRGLAKNPGLQQTALAIQIARESVTAKSSERLPQASLTLQQTKEESQTSRYQSSLSVNWTLDWLGKLQDGVDADQARLLNSKAADQYARDLLAATIIDTWLRLVQQQQLITIEQQRLQVLEQNESTIVERYRKGLGNLTDLDSARSQSASSRATLADYRESYQTLLRSMAVLLGEQTYGTTLPAQYPRVLVPLAGLPAQDLGRRPDLQQAYLTIRSADLDSAAAYKALLPSLSLNASLNDSSTLFRDSLLSSPAWALLGQLSAPLFQGGKLRSDIRRSELNAEQAYWAYQETLLAAVKEVEDALGQERALAEQQLHIDEALANALRSAEIYQTKYRQGLVSFLDLLTVQAQTFDLQARKTQLAYNRLTNRITLGLALGLGVQS